MADRETGMGAGSSETTAEVQGRDDGGREGMGWEMEKNGDEIGQTCCSDVTMEVRRHPNSGAIHTHII